VYAVLPSSLAFLVAYSIATQHLSRPALFNAILTGFMAFFVVFAFGLYPHHASLHPHDWADSAAQVGGCGVTVDVGVSVTMEAGGGTNFATQHCENNDGARSTIG
jgi:AAA family ATP:ADP antiporter